MAYADLTTEQQQQVDAFMTMVRPWCGEFARLHNHGAAAFTQYWATINALISGWETTDVIPNKSGLAGAVDITKAEASVVLAWIEGVATTNSESNRQLMAKMVGGGNLVG